MRRKLKALCGPDELTSAAGLGALKWREWTYRVLRDSKYIFMGFTALIFGVTILQRQAYVLAAVGLVGYVLYLKFRHKLAMPIRVQVGIVAVTALLFYFPFTPADMLWLLFVPVIYAASRRCSSRHSLLAYSESCLALAFVHLRADSWDWFLLINQALWIGFISFLLFYLTKNLEARRKIIKAFVAWGEEWSDLTDQEAAAHYLERLLMRVVEHFDTTSAMFWTRDPISHQLKCSAFVKRQHSPQGDIYVAIPVDKCLTRTDKCFAAIAAKTGELQVSTLLKSKGYDHSNQSAIYELDSRTDIEVAAPVNVGHRPRHSTVGVLSLGFRKDHFHQGYLPAFADFLVPFCAQVAPYMAYLQVLAQLSTVDLMRSSSSAKNGLNAVLDSVIQTVVAAFRFDFGAISLVDRARNIIYMARGSKGVSPEWVKLAVHTLDSDDIQAYVARHRRSEIPEKNDPRLDPKIVDKFGHRGMIRVFTPLIYSNPLTGEEQVTGTIEVGYLRDSIEITDDQKRVLEFLGSHIARIIEQTRDHEETQRQATRAVQLNEIAGRMVASHNQDELFERIGAGAKELFNADLVMLYPVKEKGTLNVPHCWGELRHNFKPRLTLDSDNVLKHILDREKPLFISAINNESPDVVTIGEVSAGYKPTSRHFTQRQGIVSFAGMPLTNDGVLLALLYVNFREYHAFSASEKQLFELFMRHASLAIRNMQLVNVARENAREEERRNLAREVHQSISTALYSIKVASHILIRDMPSHDPKHADLQAIHDIAHDANRRTSFILQELRAPTDDSRMAGLAAFVNNVRAWHKIDVSLFCDEVDQLDAKIEHAIVRFAREAINNAIKHARCSQICITIKREGEQLLALVSDDGIGFCVDDLPENPQQHGIRSMKEWAQQVSGQVRFAPSPRMGCEVEFCVPMKDEAETEEDE